MATERLSRRTKSASGAEAWAATSVAGRVSIGRTVSASGAQASAAVSVATTVSAKMVSAAWFLPSSVAPKSFPSASTAAQAITTQIGRTDQMVTTITVLVGEQRAGQDSKW